MELFFLFYFEFNLFGNHSLKLLFVLKNKKNKEANTKIMFLFRKNNNSFGRIPKSLILFRKRKPTGPYFLKLMISLENLQCPVFTLG